MLHPQIGTPRRSTPVAIYALATVLVAALFAADSASAATYRVTKVGDPAPVACLPTDCSLREAVRAANATPAADRIVLGARTYRLSQAGDDDDAQAGDLDVVAASGGLTVVGKGQGKTTIIQDATDRVFHVGAGAGLTLRRLAVADGEATHGGAIRNEGNLLALQAAVRGSEASFGGGIFSTGEAQTTIRRTLVAGNTSVFGGGIFDNNESVVRVVRSTLRNNDATGTGGGGIFHQNQSRLVVRKSTIDRNRASGNLSSGAGIFVQNQSVATIAQSTISRNRATGSSGAGGGIVASNQASLRVVNSTVSGNEAQYGGGAELRGQGRVLFHFSTIARNRARDTGGAIFEDNSPPGPPPPPYLTFRATIVAANSAPGVDNCAVGDAANFRSQGANLEDANSCQFTRANDRRNTNPRLRLKLARNGGPTRTHALRRRSPAVDSAPRKGCPNRDQRGTKRPQGRRCDRGAFELRA